MPEREDAERVDVCGTAITRCRRDDVRHMIARACAERRGRPVTLATVNLDFLRLADEDAAFADLLDRFTHRVADGWPVLALAARAGRPLPERVTGSDLTPSICGWAREHGWRMALVGAGEEVRRRLRRPLGDVCVGHWTPRYGAAVEDPALAAEIRRRRADVLLVALGCPKQERWIAANAAASGVAFAVGVGAGLDFLAGTVPRAPRAMRRLRLEFLHRWLLEPRRLTGRYLRDLLFYARARRMAAVAPSRGFHHERP